MCTLTWLRRPDGYELFFSRDELRSRLPALPPTAQRLRGVEVLAPRDADGGGTWLAINAWGLSVALLNGAAGTTEPQQPVSRGLLVLELADAHDSTEVALRLERADLTRHRPFQLAALESGEPLLQAQWDGQRLELTRLSDDFQPLSSSSLDPLGAGRGRRALLQRMLEAAGRPSEQLLLAFHSSHEASSGALAPCMHRTEAETVSFSRTRVMGCAVELGYSPAAPCRGQPLHWIGLERLPATPAAQPRSESAAYSAPRP